MTKKEAIEKVHYHWDLTGDIEACPDYNEELFREMFPGIYAAWIEVKASRRMLSALIDYEMKKGK